MQWSLLTACVSAQVEAEKKQAELEASIASLTSDVSAAKAAAEAELKRAHAAADAKIQTYNERTSEVRPEAP